MTRLGSAATGAPAASAVTATPVTRRALFERLREAARVVAVSAPAGSGKTVLLRSWAGEEGLTERVAWVSVRYEERDPQGFWVSVLDALRGTAGGKTRVRGFTAAPDLDGWAIVERLLEDLAELDTPLWLVIDDLHELRSTEAQRQLELFLMRAPAELRFVLSGRHDLGLGLHRLRLEAELTEIRARDMRFTLDEAQALFDAAGVEVAPSALELLVERTEGWAAGLRLAALSLAGHPDPERVAAEFSGSERTVSQYLLAEVLDRQPEEVRRLLLRTSLLEHVTGPLADLLSGGSGGERILQELEEANAFVVSLDAGRSRFRYYRLFADLLQLELRRTAPEEVPALHGAAAEWYAEHGYPVDAIRQAQAAGNRDLAVRLLLEHWFALYFDAEATTAHDLLARFAAGTVADAAELAALTAAEHLGRGTLQEAERHLALAAQRSASVPADRRRRFEITLAALWLQLAHQRGDLPAVAEQAQRLLAVADAPETVHLELADDLRAFALINLGIAELGDRAEDADRHLDQGIALAHRMERPYLELTGLAHATLLAFHQSYARAAECSMQAIELAERHGWAEEPIVGVAYAVLGGALVAQGRLEEAEPWLRRAERALRAEVEPAATVTLYDFRGLFELASGHHAEALDAFRTAERLGGLLVTPSSNAVRLHVVQTLAKMGDVEGAEAAFGETDEQERDSGHARVALAVLLLAQDDPQGAAAAVAPVSDGSAAMPSPLEEVEALLLEATARDALGDSEAAACALEHALDLAEPDGILLPFLLHPAPGLLERHHRNRTAHAGLLSEILDLLAGAKPPRRGEPERLRAPLTESEVRVLRYLPTNLSQPEIAGELSLSVNTVNTHVRHVYSKLGAHRRQDAVERARRLGMLAPSPRRR